MNTLIVPSILVVLAIAGCSGDDGVATPTPFPAFTDDFGDGKIDAAIWSYGGQVSEQGGYIRLRRQTPADFLETRNTYSGNWKVTMTVRLSTIHWNDMFHGISLRDRDGMGVSFGFSRYGKLFMAQHDGAGGISFAYGPEGSNIPGQWQIWTLERIAGQVVVTVDGKPVPGLSSGEVPEKVRLAIPGYHQDGDGGDTTGVTASDIDLILVEAAS